MGSYSKAHAGAAGTPIVRTSRSKMAKPEVFMGVLLRTGTRDIGVLAPKKFVDGSYLPPNNRSKSFDQHCVAIEVA